MKWIDYLNLLDFLYLLIHRNNVQGNLIIKPPGAQTEGPNCYSPSDLPVWPPTYYKSTGVPDTDLVIFVTARPVQNDNVLAFAGECSALPYV